MTSFRSQRRRHAALLFVGLFVFAVFTQLGVGWYQRRGAARNNLRAAADEIHRELRYSNRRWDLIRFRQADLRANRYYILDRSGVIIDIEGFVAELGFRADLTELQPGVQSLTVPLTNETWRILLARLSGGLVVLGFSSPDNVTRVDERLQENAKRFGSSLEDALGTSPSDTDRDLEYVILDDSGRVRFALGAIPLKLLDSPRFPLDEIKEIRTSKSVPYGFLSVPFVDSTGQTVGTVTVFDELPPQPWLSLRAWLANLSSSLALALVGTLIGVRYIRDEFNPADLLRDALQGGESSTAEFKEALRWDHWPASQDQRNDSKKVPETKRTAEAIAVKTVTGFLNSRLGGTLFIGIADDKRIVGLDLDYESLVKPGENRGGPDKDRDRFQLHLRNLLAAKIGREVSNLCVETAILP